MKGERQRHSSPDALRSAYDEVLRAEATKAASLPRPLASSRRGFWLGLGFGLVAVLITVAAVVFWPEGPESRPIQTAGTQSRQLMAVALEIEDYRRNTGRLPTSLKALGLDLPQIEFALLPDQQFELRTSTGHHALVLRSGDSEPRTERYPAGAPPESNRRR